jgi:hypothetical protein
MHHQRLLNLNKNQEREEDGARKKIKALRINKFSPMIKIMQTTLFQIVMPVTLMMTWIET